MTHHHRHHDHPHAAGPTIAPSILRLSALERLAAVAAIVAALWGAMAWAMA